MLSWKFLTLCILFRTVLSLELSRIIESASLKRSKKGTIDSKPGGHVGLLGFSLSDTLRNIKHQNEAGANRQTSYFQFQPDRTLEGKTISKEDVVSKKVVDPLTSSGTGNKYPYHHEIPSKRFETPKDLDSHDQGPHQTSKSLVTVPAKSYKPPYILQSQKYNLRSSHQKNVRISAQDHVEAVTGQQNRPISNDDILKESPTAEKESNGDIMSKAEKGMKKLSQVQDEEEVYQQTHEHLQRRPGTLRKEKSIEIDTEQPVDNDKDQSSRVGQNVKEDYFASSTRAKLTLRDKNREVLSEEINGLMKTENRPDLKSVAIRPNQLKPIEKLLLVTPINPRIPVEPISKANDLVHMTEREKTRSQATRITQQSSKDEFLADKDAETEKRPQPHANVFDRLRSPSKFSLADQNRPEKATDKIVSSSLTGLPDQTGRQNKAEKTGNADKLKNAEQVSRARESIAKLQVSIARGGIRREILRGSPDSGAFEETVTPKLVESKKDLFIVEKSDPEGRGSQGVNSPVEMKPAKGSPKSDPSNQEKKLESHQQDPTKVTQSPTQPLLITKDSFEMNSRGPHHDLEWKAGIRDDLDPEKDPSTMNLPQEQSSNTDSSKTVPSNPQSHIEDRTSDPQGDSSTTKSEKALAKKNKKKQSTKNKKAGLKEDDKDSHESKLFDEYAQDMNNERLSEAEFNNLKGLIDEKLEADSVDALVNQVMRLHDNQKNLKIILTEAEFINLNEHMNQNLQSWVKVKVGLWNKFSIVTEARLRFISFSEQYTQKMIVYNWKNVKRFLSSSAVKFAQALKAEEEFPVFGELAMKNWIELQNNFAPVMSDDVQKELVVGLFCGRYADRLATLHLMAHLDQQYTEYMKPRMGELMRRGAKASVLLLISSLLEYPSAVESWGSFSNDKMIGQAELLSQALMGKYFPVNDNANIHMKIFDDSSHDWLREYTRDVLLNTNGHVLPSFEAKLKKFIHFCDKQTYSYREMIFRVGETLTGFHIGIDRDRLFDLFQVMKAARVKWHPTVRKWTVKKWPKSLPSELVGKEDLIKQFFDFRNEKVQGLDTQIEKWKGQH